MQRFLQVTILKPCGQSEDTMNMFKTEPFVSDKVWGYERWIVSTHAAGQSRIADTGSALDGKSITETVGADYPLLIKLIQANDTLSVQVHPDDDYARRVENTFGKTECWYILDAVPGATLVCGLNSGCTKEELAEAIKQNTLDKYLKVIPVKKGDFIFIPAGTVHAIQGGLRLLEVQEPSDITYRLYDWGRPREIHVEKGLEVTECTHSDPLENFDGTFACEYFSLSHQTFESTDYSDLWDPSQAVLPEVPQWISAFIIEGNGTICDGNGEEINVCKEEMIMLRSSGTYTAKSTDGSPLKLMIIE